MAHRLAQRLDKGDVIGLQGTLGAGKTCFIQGLAKGLEVPPEIKITSPTFTLINEYKGGRLLLIHADLYRIEQSNELMNLGLDERLELGVGAIEWADKYDVLPRRHLLLRFEIKSESERSIEAIAKGARFEALLEQWKSDGSGR